VAQSRGASLSDGPAGAGRPRVLVLSREYPNRVSELSGVWVERLVRSSTRLCEPRVIAPVPYAPRVPRSEYYAQFRRIERHEETGGVDVFHPRFVIGPGARLRSTEASAYYAGVRRTADRLRDESRFDLIHAHFTYPDGVAAVRLGRRYRVPVLITEQVPWGPWLERQPLIRRQMTWAGANVDAHIAISRSVRDQIGRYTRRPDKVRVIPDGVDGSEFPLANGRHAQVADQILYVGHINEVKGVDVLLRAMPHVVAQRPTARLVLVGGSFYRAKALLGERMQALAGELGLGRHVEFVGAQPQAELIRHMHESSLLVLPSRAESFGCVLVEALACGKPVVATRCGGPEDIVHDGVGRLVTPGDERSLASAILEVLTRGDQYDPAQLRAYALENFSWDRVADRTVEVYRELLSGGR
jgi:glycosyltransferase involved in cell wall biosynthesis